jgi:AraC-like DNA-binding protein
MSQQTRSGGAGLERSCRTDGEAWIASEGPVGGVERFRAWLGREAYDKHRHDTYAIGLTDRGVQVFDYRGAERVSLPGQVVVLHPDERHDGRAGTRDGFGYRIVYVEPVRIAEALRSLAGHARPLPFVRESVARHAALARAVRRAFASPLDELAADALVAEIAQGLLAGEGAAPVAPRLDAAAVERARQLLDAERTRPVRSRELEAASGLSRYELARQFRLALGTSPHRYLLMRRLDTAREAMHRGRPLAEVADEVGFADQAHFTRVFKAASGLTPGRYRVLRARSE